MTSRPGYVWHPTGPPTPREIRALVAVSDGCSLSVAADRLKIPVTSLSGILSIVYARLGVKDIPAHRLSHDRREAAIKACKDNGWWPQ